MVGANISVEVTWTACTIPMGKRAHIIKWENMSGNMSGNMSHFPYEHIMKLNLMIANSNQLPPWNMNNRRVASAAYGFKGLF